MMTPSNGTNNNNSSSSTSTTTSTTTTVTTTSPDETNNNKFDATTKIVADYQKLKRVRLIKPALKKYLAGKVQSKFRRIDADEFTIAALLPVARFKKASIAQVHRDSRGMI